jgi:hypothetical protein
LEADALHKRIDETRLRERRREGREKSRERAENIGLFLIDEIPQYSCNTSVQLRNNIYYILSTYQDGYEPRKRTHDGNAS